MKILRILIVICCAAAFSFGQFTNKSFILTGKVFDANEALIPDAEILLKDASGKTYVTKTGGDGKYKIVLPFGSYTMEAVAGGFKTHRVSNLNVGWETERNLNLTLDVRDCDDCEGMIDTGGRKNESVFNLGVYDQNGAVIENAQIKIRDSENKFSREAKTDADGVYKINLPDGVYTIEISAVGFKTFRISNYEAGRGRNNFKFNVLLDVKDCDDPTVICSVLTSDPIKPN